VCRHGHDADAVRWVGAAFPAQVHAPGVEAEVDWGQALVDFAGTRTNVHLFLMRASLSGAALCQASLAGEVQGLRAGLAAAGPALEHGLDQEDSSGHVQAGCGAFGSSPSSV
jgi:hypothetical protein